MTTHSGIGLDGELPSYECDLDHRPVRYRRGRAEALIAWIYLKSFLGDTISVCARRSSDGSIEYRVVDDCGYPTYALLRCESDLPLTLRELIELIETTEIFDGDQLLRLCYDVPGSEFEGRGLVFPTWREQLVRGAKTIFSARPPTSPREAVAFATISSHYYPGLSRWYAAAGSAWIAARLLEQRVADREEECDEESILQVVHELVGRANWARASESETNWANARTPAEIVAFVRDHLERHDRLPEGRHSVRGLPVNFPSASQILAKKYSAV